MTIDEFLSQFVEGYLFNDLISMGNIKRRPPSVGGECGYPMVSAVISGCELFGGLLCKERYNPKQGKHYFVSYWSDYLINFNPRYGVSELGRLVYQLVRNGVAHTFVAKQGITITKFQPEHHLDIDTASGRLTIDATSLSKDFIKSYTKFVKPLLPDQSSRALMDRNFQIMINGYVKESSSCFARLPSQQQSALASAISSTASGSDFRSQAAGGTALPFQ
jgi:hypothetical protein